MPIKDSVALVHRLHILVERAFRTSVGFPAKSERERDLRHALAEFVVSLGLDPDMSQALYHAAMNPNIPEGDAVWDDTSNPATTMGYTLYPDPFPADLLALLQPGNAVRVTNPKRFNRLARSSLLHMLAVVDGDQFVYKSWGGPGTRWSYGIEWSYAFWLEWRDGKLTKG